MNSALYLALKRTSLYIFIGLLAYMPLHIFLSTWFGSLTGALELAKVAKDGVLVVGLALTVAISIRQPWFKELIKDKLLWLIALYGLFTLLLAIIRPTDPDAEVLGLVYNTRFLLFFVYGMLLVKLFPVLYVRTLALKAVVASAAIVVVFGLVQYFVLPNDALIHLGYSRDAGVLPAFFIDDKPDLERVMSTLRDPNSLGSYLIIVTALAAVGVVKRTGRQKKLLTVLLILSIVCLWLTFSRSALIGLILALGVLFALGGNRFGRTVGRYKRHLFAGSLIVLLLLAGSVYAVRNTYFVQNVIFHADQTTTLESPNELRIKFINESVDRIADNPSGSGPGTAGIASIRNNVQGTILNENYYLQIATEVGLAGLALFVAILAVVARRLYAQRQSLLAVGLLAAFVGLAFTNLLVHIWSNEAVAFTWWGMAGLALSGSSTHKAINKRRNNAKSKIT